MGILCLEEFEEVLAQPQACLPALYGEANLVCPWVKDSIDACIVFKLQRKLPSARRIRSLSCLRLPVSRASTPCGL